MVIAERLSFFAALFRVDENPELGMWLLYITIFILSVVVYKLGFAQKLSVFKSIIIYVFLALGCTILTFLGAFLPVAEGLLVAAGILVAYKVRLRKFKQEQASKR
ncbi:hypothetical protein EJF36_08400 [Bacillus sp. HMF5848]|uniref:YlaH-like family protein n=1 Tax=Bacillus sp. HMF5848 TaxID=2495421 RepID=UPI000F7968F5|nr:hypothetical protein EJF36_08400 [Bacillus sp. HMF5848]